jgi:hypothetical protein
VAFEQSTGAIVIFKFVGYKFVGRPVPTDYVGHRGFKKYRCQEKYNNYYITFHNDMNNNPDRRAGRVRLFGKSDRPASTGFSRQDGAEFAAVLRMYARRSHVIPYSTRKSPTDPRTTGAK